MPRPSSEEKVREWQERIHQQRESNLSIEKWCRERQISSHTFHYWKDRLAPQPPLSRSSFTELALVEETSISLEYRGFHVHFSKRFDPNVFKSCLSALRELKC